MSHPKFNALAEKLSRRRLGHLSRVSRPEEPAFQHKSFQIPQDPGINPQLPFPFARGEGTLDVFRRFNSASREIEWSYYSGAGEFLINFSFNLEDKSYQIISLHPGLLKSKGIMEKYLASLQKDLQGIYPGLELIRLAGEGPVIRPRETSL